MPRFSSPLASSGEIYMLESTTQFLDWTGLRTCLYSYQYSYQHRKQMRGPRLCITECTVPHITLANALERAMVVCETVQHPNISSGVHRSEEKEERNEESSSLEKSKGLYTLSCNEHELQSVFSQARSTITTKTHEKPAHIWD